MQIIVERIRHNGHLCLTAFYGDEMIKQVYIGHTLKEAKDRFRRYLKEEIKTRF